MPGSEKLFIKKSGLPQAGKGLFTKVPIAKGEIITEYEGRRCTWKDVEDDVDNGYLYQISEKLVIDASENTASFGRYANDAAGLQRIKGLSNNAEYVEDGNRVFIKSKKNIAPGCEIFVAYGREYWKQARENMKIERDQKRITGKKR